MSQKPNITKEFWDFIEENIPNYHERDDVSRQANLQAFLDDGDETHVKGITREEATILRDHILSNLYHEAIDNFTSKLPVAITGETSLYNYAEALVDIAYEAGTREFCASKNSRDTTSTIITWANQFTRSHKNTDWNEVDYLESVYQFFDSKFKAHNTAITDDTHAINP